MPVMPCDSTGPADQEPGARSDGMHPHPHTPLAILSGLPTIAGLFMAHLEQLGFRSDPTAGLWLILDSPHSFALRTLAAHGTHVPAARRVVATASSCPEYLEDLWEYGLEGLVADGSNPHALATALHHVARGMRYRATPTPPTTLTPRERQLLRLLADGLTPREIAGRLCFGHQSIKNAVAQVYAKLGVANQREAMLYYWGVGGTRAP